MNARSAYDAIKAQLKQSGISYTFSINNEVRLSFTVDSVSITLSFNSTNDTIGVFAKSKGLVVFEVYTNYEISKQCGTTCIDLTNKWPKGFSIVCGGDKRWKI